QHPINVKEIYQSEIKSMPAVDERKIDALSASLQFGKRTVRWLFDEPYNIAIPRSANIRDTDTVPGVSPGTAVLIRVDRNVLSSASNFESVAYEEGGDTIRQPDLQRHCRIELEDDLLKKLALERGNRGVYFDNTVSVCSPRRGTFENFV